MDWRERYNEWMSAELLEKGLRTELEAVTDEGALEERFYQELEFGTAGLRGVIGAGSNRMNLHIVDRATRGLAEHILAASGASSCAIAYDSRIMSREFAHAAAAALAEKGVKVWLFRDLTPTPMLSFAVRRLGCGGGIVITASHNPSEYNGYKAYGPDGSQLNIEDSESVMALIAREPLFRELPDFDLWCERGVISFIGDDLINDYYDYILSLSMRKPQVPVSVVYSPLNGTGNIPVRHILDAIGNVSVTVVPQQELPDGTFPTCPYPNPEIPDTMKLAAELAKTSNADLFFATDPDSDRLSAGVIQNGEVRLFNGNELGVLLVDYVCRMRKENGTMPPHPATIKTVVTSGMAKKAAESYGVEMVDLLTGFRFIGEQIGRWEKDGDKQFIFGFEESCGYLSGGQVRDKDAVNSSMLLCEMAAWYKEQGMTLNDAMDALYDRLGYYRSIGISVAFKGVSGMDKMNALLDGVRSSLPESFAGIKVVRFVDYKYDDTGLPSNNVLRFFLEDGSELVMRPSGTEPKLKFYVTAVDADENVCSEKAERLAECCRDIAAV